MINTKEAKFKTSNNIVGTKNHYVTAFVMMFLAVFFVLFPLYTVFTTSLMSKYEALGTAFKLWPEQGVSFDSYKTILVDQIGGYSVLGGFVNTIIYYLPTAAIGTIVSAMAAFAFAKLRFKASNAMFSILMLNLLVPNSMGMITSFLLYDTLGWIGTPMPIMIPICFGGISAVFFLRQFYLKIPDDLVGCAKLDGLGYLGMFFRIMLPISMPAITAQFILTFIGGYNDYMGPLLYLSGDAKMATLQLALAQYQDPRIQDWPLRMAGAFTAMTPLVVMYLCSQKLILKGLDVSAGFKG